MSPAFTPLSALLGGALIGSAAVLLLVANGRVAGVSGIVGGLIRPAHADIAWRVAFIVGILLGALCYWIARGERFPVDLNASWGTLVVGGVLVGFGTRMGGGCTSGHGVCGLARLSPTSMAATLVFMGSAMATVYVTRHLMDRGPI